MQDFSFLCEIARQAGFVNAGIIAVEKIPFDPGFRKACEANQCGNYGKCWTCPPDVGEIDDLIRQAKQYRWAVVYQTIGQLEDSYDFEGMMEAGKRHNELAQKLRAFTRERRKERQDGPESETVCTEEPEGVSFLHLGAGGCRVCSVCAKVTGEPCRHPDMAMRSLETYGINVSLLAQEAGMRYINGQNTVTYFGAVFMRGGRPQEPEKERR